VRFALFACLKSSIFSSTHELATGDHRARNKQTINPPATILARARNRTTAGRGRESSSISTASSSSASSSWKGRRDSEPEFFHGNNVVARREVSQRTLFRRLGQSL